MENPCPKMVQNLTFTPLGFQIRYKYMLKRLLALAVTTGLALPSFSAEKQPDNIISIPEGPYYSPFIVVVDKLNRKTSVWREC